MKVICLILILLCACTPMLSNEEHVVLQQQHDTIIQNQNLLMEKLNQINDNQAIQDSNMRKVCGVEGEK